jgi:hypothetical protein
LTGRLDQTGKPQGESANGVGNPDPRLWYEQPAVLFSGEKFSFIRFSRLIICVTQRLPGALLLENCWDEVTCATPHPDVTDGLPLDFGGASLFKWNRNDP